MAARVSVVVPIYNVAPYLETCLQSIAAQTLRDIEVVMVEDGSTDDSPSIAEAFSERDRRFRLVRQANAGLGAARNTGIEHATGDFLVFADSDDAVPVDAYELMLSTLEETGSDFVTGKTMRFTGSGGAHTSFHGRAFERTRLKTHITRFPPLRIDRTAWNKLFRRSFWDEHAFRFPEGVYYEDTPVMLPAHYVAGSVDVLEEIVYFWRVREGSDLSITQKRTELKSLRDRFSAVDHVSRFLAERGMMVSKALYDWSVVKHDLRYFLAVLPSADDRYRQLFLELANDFLDRAHRSTIDQPLAIDRLLWQLVRRRALPELLEVLRFEADDLRSTPPCRKGRRWYGNYPYRRDKRLAIPDDVYRLREELAPVARVEEVRWEGENLRLEGYAYIDLLGAPAPGHQRVELTAVRSGFPPKRVALHLEEVHRPDLTNTTEQQLVSLDYSGFVGVLRGSELRHGDKWLPGSWELRVSIKADGVRRRTKRLDHAPLCPVPQAEFVPMEGIRVHAAVSRGGELRVRILEERSLVPTVRVEETVVELEGELSGSVGGPVSLEVVVAGESPRSYPAHVDRSRRRPAFLARVPSADLAGAPIVQLVNGSKRMPLRLRGLSLGATPRRRKAAVTDVELSTSGAVRVAGLLGRERHEQLVLAGVGTPQSFSVPLEIDGEGGFSAEVRPEQMETPRGPKPLSEGIYELRLASAQASGAVGLPVEPDLLRRLPVSGAAGRKRFHLGIWREGPLVLAAERDLDDGERGGRAQRRLRTSVYPRARTDKLRDAVLYESFSGSECSDSPRAVFEELLRRRAPFEHLWIVDDGAFDAPEGSTAIRKGSREFYDAYACARYVVANDHWPRWFRRRPNQVAVQTWHGAPLKFQGRELEERPPAFREYRRALEMGEPWDQVVSPGPFASPILELGYEIAGDVLETGLPRTDLLLGHAAERRRAEVRRALGLTDERVILYAPTYRDSLDYAVRHRASLLRDAPTYGYDLAHPDGYRLWEPLDLVGFAAGLGADHALLFYKHPRVADPTPAALAAAGRDVAGHPDGLELLLAADVLVTDYSSWLFDFAAAGRPVILFAPDLENYRDDMRGLHIDLERDGPGPVVRTTDEVVEALASTDVWTARREAFAKQYCSLSDGQAAGRLVERVFDW
jgi:CDP-glycerol glycerophosphotransferase